MSLLNTTHYRAAIWSHMERDDPAGGTPKAIADRLNAGVPLRIDAGAGAFAGLGPPASEPGLKTPGLKATHLLAGAAVADSVGFNVDGSSDTPLVGDTFQLPGSDQWFFVLTVGSISSGAWPLTFSPKLPVAVPNNTGILNPVQFGRWARHPGKWPLRNLSIAENPQARGAVLSGLKVTRGKTETAPADGEISPHRYGSNIRDVSDRTYTCMVDDAWASGSYTSPYGFLRRLEAGGWPFMLIEWPNLSARSAYALNSYRVSDMDHPKSGGEQQQCTFTFSSDGETDFIANDMR